MPARERILATAYELFGARGIRDVGVDEIVRRSEVAKATLYKHFPSKDDLVLAFLHQHEERCTEAIEMEAVRRSARGEGRLLAIFDVLDEWFGEDGYRGCPFLTVLAEFGPPHPIGQAAVEHLDRLRRVARRFAIEAGLEDPDGVSEGWQLLMLGSMLSAASGDPGAARRAQAIGAALLDGTPRSRDLASLGAISSEHHPHDHVVNLYDEDEHLVDDACRFLAEGLTASDAIIVLSTAAHRDAFEARLKDMGVDVSAALAEGRFQWLDAAETLAAFMHEGRPDPERFATTIGAMISAASEGGRPVRAFGEMVSLLWDDDNVAGALALESLWNDLAANHQFSLYCAYPLAALSGVRDLRDVQQVCAHHSHLIAPKSYAIRTGRREGGARPPEARSEVFPPIPAAVGAARQLAEAALGATPDPALAHDVPLVVSELAANAVLHARSAFRLTVEPSKPGVRILVEDLSTVTPRPKSPPSSATSGRGLQMIDLMSARWGADPSADGKTVWVELDGSTG